MEEDSATIGDNDRGELLSDSPTSDNNDSGEDIILAVAGNYNSEGSSEESSEESRSEVDGYSVYASMIRPGRLYTLKLMFFLETATRFPEKI